jgi:alkylation response protein AidB-like acyl-CoA dehydrogenase
VPGGSAVTTPDGYRLSGRWDFASTCDHADFAVLAAFVVPEPGAAPTGMASFLVERGQFSIEDNWHVRACGHRQQARVVDDVGSPARRCHRSTASPATRDHGARPSRPVCPEAPSPRSASRACAGIASGAIDRFRERLAGTLRVASAKSVEQQVGAQLRLAEAAAEVDAAELMCFATAPR